MSLYTADSSIRYHTQMATLRAEAFDWGPSHSCTKRGVEMGHSGLGVS